MSVPMTTDLQPLAPPTKGRRRWRRLLSKTTLALGAAHLLAVRDGHSLTFAPPQALPPSRPLQANADAVPAASRMESRRQLSRQGQSSPWSPLPERQRAGLRKRVALFSGTAPVTQTTPAVAAANGGVSLPIAVVNLVKNIVGISMFTFAGGVAAMSNSSWALVPALILLLLTAIVSAYACNLLIKGCDATNAKDYAGAWAAAIGPGSQWIVAYSVIIKVFFTLVIFNMVISDSTSALMHIDRVTALLLTSGALLPLCLQRSLDALKYSSSVGVAAILYAIGAQLTRFWQGAYLPGGALHTAIASEMVPKFGDLAHTTWSAPALLPLTTRLLFAYAIHYNSPKFFRELRQPSVAKFERLTKYGFIGGTAIYMIAMCTGFLTFGGSCTGFIFDNYAASDNLICLARAAVTFSLFCTYPLLFAGFRDQFEQVLTDVHKFKPGATGSHFVRTSVLLGGVTAFAAVMKDVSTAASLVGAFLGTAVVYIFPAMIYLALAKGKKIEATKFDVLASRGLIGIGVMVTAVSALSTLGFI
eukprot:TRINITY_DN24367_c0_g1_i1.p1 TRINITY_DN24367_c0_g1~~TRINITY_DN24367_c0_g1_i1.p1  ORF type:complete len:531 (-),score=105.51 TRINITY_DN24367_c0_g1_i1:215-1807(-)